MTDFEFEAVHLPEGRELNGKASQTFLRHYNQCPRSAFLYAFFKGEASTVEMVRGSALHAVCERGTQAAIQAGEPTIPPELVKAIADEVLLDYPVPIEEHDYIREMAYRWGAEWTIDPGAVIACETLFVWAVGGWQVRAKIDFAQLEDRGRRCRVVDYKSSRAAPAYEDIARKDRDGRLTAKGFQNILYALTLKHGVPVRESVDVVTGERLEVLEPFPLAGGVQEFELEFVFPGIPVGDDRQMLRRGVLLSAGELEPYRTSMEALLARLDVSLREGDWPAVVSDGACGECPASVLCPIPKELRDHRGEIATVAQAAEALERGDRIKAEQAAIRREVKAFAKHHGISIRFGRDKVARFVTRESEALVDREGMFEAARRASEYGEDFVPANFLQHKVSTTFADEKLSEEELAAEAAEREVQDGSSD